MSDWKYLQARLWFAYFEPKNMSMDREDTAIFDLKILYNFIFRFFFIKIGVFGAVSVLLIG